MTSTRVRNYLSSGAEPKMVNDRVVLSLGPRKQITLRGDNGTLTNAGKSWEQQTGRALMDGGFQNQIPQRDGNVETIKLRSGQRAVTRRWVPSLNKWRFTNLGKRFYKTLTRNYVVSVPTYKIGRRRDNSNYRIDNIHVPLSLLGINTPSIALDLDEDSRYAKIKSLVMAELTDAANGAALLSHSDETWYYDPNGDFKISEETIGVEGKQPVAYVNALEKSLGTNPVQDPSFLLFKQLLPQAFENHNDRLCVPRQIAHILKRDMGDVIRDLQAFTPKDVEEGVNGRVVFEFAKSLGLGAVCVHGDRVIERLSCELGKPVLAFLINDDHAYFYKPKAAELLLHRFGEQKAGATQERLARDVVSDVPCPSSWLPFEAILPGHFYVQTEEELHTIRVDLLKKERGVGSLCATPAALGRCRLPSTRLCARYI